MRHSSNVIHKLYIGCFVAIVLSAVILRMYKACYTGVIYDEALTYFRFARDFNSAVSDYSTTNNHLLNSVLIYLSVNIFGQLGNFMGVPAIRLPAVVFGIVYVVSIAIIIEAALRSRPLKLLVLALCLSNYFIFDLSILARGYAIALGAVYCELLLVIFYPTLLKDYDKSMVFLLSALNFIALGAMLTSLYTIVPINLAFLAVMYHTKNACVATGKPSGAFKKVFEMGSAIMCFSSLPLALLYINVIKTIISAAAVNSEINEAPATILKALITEGLFSKWGFHLWNLEMITRAIMLPVMLILAVLFILNIIVNKKTLTPAALIILSVLAASFSLAYIAHTAAGLSLGFTRNHVFWLPMIVLAGGIIADGALDARIIGTWFMRAGTCLVCLVLIILTAGPLASLHVVTTYDWKPQSVVGPLLRELKKIDATRRWRVGFSDKLQFDLFPYLFYNGEAYRISDSDVAVYPISEQNQHPENLYEYDLFKKFDCIVALASRPRRPQI
ncbi:hypothetical protein [Candidatus Magnetominusculus dajiuhuensis]|uniref:hypothetical protein n=1 Tax=Candidatus Magnetominusculus dajiuhuensis TaxID=3137712 RepID=UPI003B4354F3